MPSITRSSLKNQMVLIIGVCVAIGTVALTAINVITAHSHATEGLHQQTKALVEAQAHALAEWAHEKSLVIASTQQLVDEADPLKGLQLLTQAGDLDNTYLGYADARYVFANPAGLAPDYNPTKRPWYQQTLQQGKAVLTPPYIDAGTKKLVVTFTALHKKDGQVHAIAGGDVFLDKVVQTVRSISPTPSGMAMLVNGKGTVIAHRDAQMALKSSRDIDPQLDIAQIRSWLDGDQLHLVSLQTQDVLMCWRRFKIEPPCRLNFEPGQMANL